ncbi:hypothetical protein BGZ95_005708 [Linnemannia exigua]|uniref:Uncharacterized protein n=1 Tax=Linnemannia exigua TaxID=604196 RepID=A0AAD4DGQ5_9FUNG|nr:hypothetical protein BGZ95_005708 [Linnemannia exigua]
MPNTYDRCMVALNPAIHSYVLREDIQRVYCYDHLLSYYQDRSGGFKPAYRHTSVFRQHFAWFIQELNWTLADPLLEQLKIITILISDIKWYFANIDRLKDLENLLIILDELPVDSPVDTSWHNYLHD